MRCNFCFATFQDVKKTILPKGHLPMEKSLDVVRSLAEAGFEKITFVGGEPTLCPWLFELILEAKLCGMNTGIVTNGTKLSEEYLSQLHPYLDWIGISVDSLQNDTNIALGRAIHGKKPLDKAYYYRLVDLVNQFGFQFKINTVVNRFNAQEDLNDFIRYANASRWKIFQVLPIKGENDLHFEELKISPVEFDGFLERHNSHSAIMVPERNEDMLGSYAMIDPAGRFFENSTSSLTYSKPILEVGVQAAYQEAHPDSEKFRQRGGQYDWNAGR
jgi:radical S-adenosyl methionine domain-containing protein 2